jgi:hypothetical protein
MKAKAALALGIIALAAAPFASAQELQRLGTNLTGYEETPLTLSTTGNGRFDAMISTDETQVVWQLSYGDLEGAVLQSHIHFGQRALTGGIAVFLCTNLGNGPAGTQACPQSGTIGGTFTAADVIGPTGQGIEPGSFAELVNAIRAGATYVNVHSSKWPGGEIRNQIGPGHSH